MTSPPERPFSHYVHSHRLAEEMWSTMKNNLLEKEFLSCSFCRYRFHKYVSYDFPIINFCNPGVPFWNALYNSVRGSPHFEMPYIFQYAPVHILKRPVYFSTWQSTFHPCWNLLSPNCLLTISAGYASRAYKSGEHLLHECHSAMPQDCPWAQRSITEFSGW